MTMRAAPAFDAHIELRPQDVVVRLRGRLDRQARRLLDGCIASACNATRPEIVVDITGVHTYDDDGFDMMANAISTCRAHGLSVKVVADDRHDAG
jgi:anti-anti-sigma regulatory factor